MPPPGALNGTNMSTRALFFSAIATTLMLAFAPRAALAAGTQSPESADMQAVRTLILDYRTAISKHDLAAIEKIWAHKPYATSVAPGGKAVAVGWSVILRNYQRTLTPYREILPAQPTIASFQSDGKMAWAVVTGSVHLRRHDGAVFNYFVIESDVFEKDAGRWYLVSRVPRPQ
ncbi:MAG: nuclear transport factor 2 family protein [Candidatus Eremiobacteraeota bacterium]|nr:nuclear transport factor 2 family protein [Candidatus Eremiobacteraeota bacterium]